MGTVSSSSAASAITVVYVHWLPTAAPGGDDGGAHGQLIGGQPGFLVGLADGGLLGRFVAVAGAAGQTPGAALMTPRRAVLQQHRG